MLEYEVAHREGDFVVVRLRGELTGGPPSQRFVRSLEEHYVDDGVAVIRLDVESLDFLNSVGLGQLLLLREECRARGKRLVLQNAAGQVRGKLEMTGVLAALQAGR